MAHAEKYIRIKELIEGTARTKLIHKEEGKIEPKKKEEMRRKPPLGYSHYTPLNEKMSEVLVAVERQSLVQPPKPMRDDLKQLKPNKYYCFHRDRGHTNQECHHLKHEIEKLIRKGYLKDFVDQSHQPHDRCPPQMRPRFKCKNNLSHSRRTSLWRFK